jgi:ABC-type multidrug transport system fused ATPase/permease subunit
MRNILTTLNYVPKIRRYAAYITALNLVLAAVLAVQPFLFKNIIDTIVNAASNASDKSVEQVAISLLFLLVLRVASAILNYFTDFQSSRIFYSILVGLRQAVFLRVTTLSTEYFEQEKTGAIVQRYGQSTGEVANWVNNSLSRLLPEIMTVIISTAIILHLNVWAGLITIIAGAIFFTLQIPVLRRLRPMAKASQKHAETASGYFSETVSNIATVRSFGGEQNAVDRQYRELLFFRDMRIKRQRALQGSVMSRQIVFSVAIILVLAIIAFGVLDGRYTAGDILLVSLYLQQIQSSLWPLGRMISDTNEIDVTAERIVEMLNTKPTVNDREDAVGLQSIETIEFKNVSFNYPGKARKVLTNVSFKLEPGQTFALVGPSGTGKTSLTKLLLRFYEPTEGEILINGEPIAHYTQTSLREHIGVVMQDVALFNDSIEENLRLANAKATKNDVRAAAKQAHAEIFIDKLPDGYKTLVGERGVKLSGGEKQRVAIARAILKDPQLIILDEATSALDSESETHVQAGLNQLMSGRTSLIIAHRLSTVMRADQILVLKNGKVVERGTHHELQDKSGGLYAKLFKLQTEGFARL